METLVPVEMERMPSGAHAWCDDPRHRAETWRTQALWRLRKPKLDPPLPGPQVIYLCQDCLEKFLLKASGFDSQN